ncbi:MAG TPA: bifunctional phosphopantothenoylcysteine decarboxylase/phosphopantothenate--cysteine ligase CoaBC [Methylovirgula sp.]|nr:bifunctional phosphopantothenoylcysteine decarboxylase/phosphopantothenate--cysteine ligase CoaBC [Methylovirgula sp.]
MSGKRVLIIIGGGIAAYKVLELIRRLRDEGVDVRVAMTAAAKHFVTELSVASLSGSKVFSDLFSLTDETEIGHIQLSRDADLLVVAPATADLLAKMAHGLANDLASTLLLATDKKILAVPAMNLRMWLNPATQRNVASLRQDGVLFIGPEDGDMACGEYGPGRMSEPHVILAAIKQTLESDTVIPLPEGLARTDGPLAGRHVIVTSGPTHEPIDPVRYIANRSSGKQGHALASAAAAAGAKVTLISGPVTLADPVNVATHHVETAEEMLAAVEAALPADILVAAAAVADWRLAEPATDKIKKGAKPGMHLELVENPDILARVAQSAKNRPALVVGFAAETRDVVTHAQDKLKRKGCDVIVANDVGPASDVMGGEDNQVTIITATKAEALPRMRKTEVAAKLIDRFANLLQIKLKEGH